MMVCAVHNLPPSQVQHPILGWLTYAPASHDASPMPERARCPQGCEWEPGKPPATTTTPTPATATDEREQAVRELAEILRAGTYPQDDNGNMQVQERRPYQGTQETVTRQKIAFLAALADKPNVYRACTAAGMSRNLPYRWRDEDKEFAQAWDDILDGAADNLGASLYERGTVERGMAGYMAAVTWLRHHETGTWIPITQVNRSNEDNELAALVRDTKAMIQEAVQAQQARQLTISSAQNTADVVVEGQVEEVGNGEVPRPL